jgi:NDP-sugar pyrophosphorylase family protein
MEKLKHNYFFSLDDFEFKELFKDKTFVWEVLGENLKLFINQKFTKNILKTQIPNNLPKDVYIEKENVFIGKNAHIESSTYIKGPVIIGNNVEIRHGAYIRGNCIIGDNCVIGHASEIKGSIMLNKSKIPHFAYMGDSIIGENVNLGAGTRLANLKVTGSNIVINHNGKNFNTNLRKFGAIIGDNTELGCNTVTSPGTLIGKNVLGYPLCHLRGFFESNSIIKNLQPLEIIKKI